MRPPGAKSLSFVTLALHNCRHNLNICLTMRFLSMRLRSEVKYSNYLLIVLVAVLFYATACLAPFLIFENTATVPSWPPSGIAFALILILGTQVWPGITIGALIAGIM